MCMHADGYVIVLLWSSGDILRGFISPSTMKVQRLELRLVTGTFDPLNHLKDHDSKRFFYYYYFMQLC